jgi:hypothetical protein
MTFRDLESRIWNLKLGIWNSLFACLLSLTLFGCSGCGGSGSAASPVSLPSAFHGSGSLRHGVPCVESWGYSVTGN